MKKHQSQSAFFDPRVLISFVFCSVGLFLALFALAFYPGGTALAQKPAKDEAVLGRAEVVRMVGPVSQDLDLRKLPYRAPNTENEGFRLTRYPWLEEQTNEKFDPIRPYRPSSQPLAMPTPLATFPGITSAQSACGCLPPDTHGDVGPNHYIQAVNSRIKIINKAGTELLAPTTYNTFFNALGATTPCGNQNQGDGFVFYDHLANRWVVSDFAFSAFPGTSFYQCIGVSKTADPVAGGWWLYALQVDPANPSFLGDYPKFGLWPDAYYLSVNLFSNNTTFNGVRVYALPRAAMINGTGAPNPGALAFTITPATLGDAYSLVPATFRTGSAPPVGTPEYFMAINSPGTAGVVQTQVFTWRFHVDFATPANSTFGLGATHTPNGTTTVTGFVDAFTTTGNIVPQPVTTVRLDTLGDKIMTPLVYQNRSGTESLWASHTVNNNQNGTGPTAIRWYQFNVTGSTIPATPVQQQTFNNGADTLWRWMPSIAVDTDGNMAIAYSTSSTAVEPSIRYAGRLSTDPANDLGQGEAVMTLGGGHQTSTSGRWGDYSALSIDPSDNLAFWHTHEYYSATSGAAWNTRIGNFKFPAGVSTPTPTPTLGTPTPTPTPGPTTPTPTPGPTTPTPTPGSPTPTPCSFSENFDGVTAPALPVGWASNFINGAANCTPTGTCALGTNWATDTTTPDTAPNSVFHNDPSCVTNASLDTPFIAIASALAQVSFRNNYNTENTFDGGVLEISINGGVFTDIVTAGGSFAAGGYNGTISTAFLSPISGRPAWTGNSGGYLNTVANLPAAAAGQSIQLRFRIATDCSVAATGWRVDTISITGVTCTTCRGPYRVLIAYADSAAPTSLPAALAAEPGIASVTLFNGGTATPTLAQLQPYDIVVPWSNTGWLDQTTLGNNLGSYLAGGGIVVALNFDWFGSVQSILGTWSTTYTPFTNPGTNNFANGTLGTCTFGPLCSGVSSLNAFFRMTMTLASGATLAGTWNDGTPMIAYKGRAIGISAYVGDSPSNYSGQFSRVIANAGFWLSPPCPTPVPTPTPTPTPPTLSISGIVTYCTNPSLNPVPGVTMTQTGTSASSTLTNGSGNYTFTGLTSGGSYTVTPSKTALAPGVDSIDGADVVAVIRHFLEFPPLLPPGCQLDAADADTQAVGVSGADIVAIQRFYLGLPNSPTSRAGQYRFTPANRSYFPLVSNQTAQNYNALIYGDVTDSFVHRPEGGPSQDAADEGADASASTVTEVSLPDLAADQSQNNFIATVTTSAIDARNKLVGFQGNITFDERVVTFESEPVRKAGLTAGNWNVSGNVLPGPGPMRALRVLGYSNDFMPLSGQGPLFEVRMIQISKAARNAPLRWAAPPHHFLFIDADLKTQKPGVLSAREH